MLIRNNVIQIDVNIDGLPISKSSKSQLWPILILIFFYDFLGKSDSVLQMQQNEDKEYIEMDINIEKDVNTENKTSNKG